MSPLGINKTGREVGGDCGALLDEGEARGLTAGARPESDDDSDGDGACRWWLSANDIADGIAQTSFYS